MEDVPLTNNIDVILDSLSIQEKILNNSRITPVGNGNKLDSEMLNTPPSGGQKWWAAVILGFVFALVSSPVAYAVTDNVLNTKSKIKNESLSKLTLHTIIFIFIVRIILW